MSQSVEVVGCRVAGRPNGELWDVFDQLSLHAYIQLQPIQCFEPPISLDCNIKAKYLYFTKKKNPNVFLFHLIGCCRF